MITLEDKLSQPEFDGFSKTSTSPCGRILKPESSSGGRQAALLKLKRNLPMLLSHMFLQLLS